MFKPGKPYILLAYMLMLAIISRFVVRQRGADELIYSSATMFFGLYVLFGLISFLWCRKVNRPIKHILVCMLSVLPGILLLLCELMRPGWGVIFLYIFVFIAQSIIFAFTLVFLSVPNWAKKNSQKVCRNEMIFIYAIGVILAITFIILLWQLFWNLLGTT